MLNWNFIFWSIDGEREARLDRSQPQVKTSQCIGFRHSLKFLRIAERSDDDATDDKIQVHSTADKSNKFLPLSFYVTARSIYEPPRSTPACRDTIPSEQVSFDRKEKSSFLFVSASLTCVAYLDNPDTDSLMVERVDLVLCGSQRFSELELVF